MNRFIFLGLLWMILGIGTVWAQTPSPTPEADALRAAGKWTEAAKAYEAVTKAEPQNGRAWYWYGMALVQTDRAEEGIAVLKQADTVAQLPIIKYQIARAYATQENREEAMTWLTQAVQAGLANIAMINGDDVWTSYTNETAFADLKTQMDRNARPCAYAENNQSLNFWVGEWDVYANGQLAGRNSISKKLSECLVFEDWTGTNGFVGQSFNYYEPSLDAWVQDWRDNFGGTVKMTAEVVGEEMIFSGQRINANGTTIQTRMTLTPLPEGRVRQFIEQSTDEGATWTVSFNGIYVPKGEALEKN